MWRMYIADLKEYVTYFAFLKGIIAFGLWRDLGGFGWPLSGVVILFGRNMVHIAIQQRKAARGIMRGGKCRLQAKGYKQKATSRDGRNLLIRCCYLSDRMPCGRSIIYYEGKQDVRDIQERGERYIFARKLNNNQVF